jgi:predicted dienelactone hydrolase
LQNIGLWGHSFGGYTAFAIAGAKPSLTTLKTECSVNNFNLNVGNISHLLQCLALNISEKSLVNLQDKRVKTIFAINPAGSSFFGEKGLNQIQIPVMLVASSDDAIAPAILEQICPFSWLNTSQKYLAFIQNGTHSDAPKQSTPTNIPFLEELTSPNPELARSYIKAISLSFAKAYVESNAKYRDYLQSNSIQKISKPPMPLTLIRSLTKNQLSQELKLTCPGNLQS